MSNVWSLQQHQAQPCADGLSSCRPRCPTPHHCVLRRCKNDTHAWQEARAGTTSKDGVVGMPSAAARRTRRWGPPGTAPATHSRCYRNADSCKDAVMGSSDGMRQGLRHRPVTHSLLPWLFPGSVSLCTRGTALVTNCLCARLCTGKHTWHGNYRLHSRCGKCRPSAWHWSNYNCFSLLMPLQPAQAAHLVALLLQALDEGRVLDGLARLAGDVVDVLLALLHPRHVVLERRQVVACRHAARTITALTPQQTSAPSLFNILFEIEACINITAVRRVGTLRGRRNKGP